MLELQNLSRSYRGIPAIRDVSFSVAPGEIVGFLGPNGAGKSTTVKIITGLLRPNDGRVLFEGADIQNDLESFRALLGYVPEEAHLYTHLSSLEYLQLVGRLRGMKEVVIEEKAKKAARSPQFGVMAVFHDFLVFKGYEAACPDRRFSHA